MSFLNSIKRSLGFGDDVDDGLLDDSADIPAAEPSSADIPRTAGAERQATAETEIDPAMVDRIFEHAVSTFNQALPSFLSDTVDPEAQRRKLYDSLDSSIKDYLAKVSQQTRLDCEARWVDEQSSMRCEMDNLKAKAKEIEQQRFDIKQQQLSSDRQRRALNDRVRDLENQIAAFDAEREQLDLENKSLINKLKVASVYEHEAETLRNELNDARSEILAMRNGDTAVVPDTAEANSALHDKITELGLEIQRLNKALDEAAEKDRLSTEMFNSMQSKSAAARNELATRDQEIAELRSQIEEARSLQTDIEQLNTQMNMIEEVIEKRDRKIARLKDTCEELRNENASLRDTIAANLKIHTEAENALNARIAELEADPTSPIVSADLQSEYTVTAQDNKPVADTPKISDTDLAAIEESFEDTGWMRTDPPDTPSMRTGLSEAEFGYQAPAKKTPHRDNDAQLSLF